MTSPRANDSAARTISSTCGEKGIIEMGFSEQLRRGAVGGGDCCKLREIARFHWEN
jgi:hypothetical protein